MEADTWTMQTRSSVNKTPCECLLLRFHGAMRLLMTCFQKRERERARGAQGGDSRATPNLHVELRQEAKVIEVDQDRRRRASGDAPGNAASLDSHTGTLAGGGGRVE
jgi:hypothetical protein